MLLSWLTMMWRTVEHAWDGAKISLAHQSPHQKDMEFNDGYIVYESIR